MVVQKMADLVIDRALQRRAAADLAALGGDDSGSARRRPSDAQTRAPMPRSDRHWHALLRGTGDRRALCGHVDGRHARAASPLRRIACSVPFLRPFFLDAGRRSAGQAGRGNALALGERRRAAPRSTRRTCCASSRSASRRSALARIDPGYATTSTAARADAFILPDSLQFAEYNGESPAGAATARGWRSCSRRRAGDGALPRARSTPASTGRSTRCSRRWWRATASGAARRRRR